MKLRYTIICLLSVLIGAIFFIIQQELIIINYPRTTFINNLSHTATKKNILLKFWHQDQWKEEQQILVWHNAIDKNIYYLINSLFTLLHDEKIIHKNINIGSVLVSEPGQTAYISFNHNPFLKQQTIMQKWMLIESILKTILHNEISVKEVQFLIHHKPLLDPHLDFSKPWPISGFAQSEQ